MSNIFVILTVLLWGSAPIFEKMALSKATPYQAVTIRSIVIALLLLLGALFSGQIGSIFKIEGRTLFFVIVGGLFAGLLGQITYFSALKGAETSTIIPLTAAFPIVTAMLGVMLLRETFTVEKFVGIMLVIIGAILINSNSFSVFLLKK